MYRNDVRRQALTEPGSMAGPPTTTSYRFCDFTLLPHRRMLMRLDQPVALGGRAFDLLQVLVENHQRIVDKDELLERVWEGRCVEESNIPVQVMRLRRLVGEDCVITVPQRGYQFTAPVQVLQLPLPDATLVPPEDVASQVPIRAAYHRPPDPGWLIGRGTDVDDALKLLQQVPSLVVTGPVGVGKSALAAAIAQAWARTGRPVAWLSADPNDDEVSVAGRLLELMQELNALSSTAIGHASTSGGEVMVVLDNTDRWLPTVCDLVRHRLAHEPGLRVMSTCPGRGRGHADAVMTVSPWRLEASLPQASEGVSLQVGAQTVQTWAADLLRRHDLRPDELGAASSPLTAAESSLWRLLDGRPGLLRITARWTAMASAEQAHAWLLKDPSLIAQAAIAPGARSLLEALNASVAMLDEPVRRAYRVLARPDKPATVNHMLRLLQRNGLTPAEALKALADLLDQHLLRRLNPGHPGEPPCLQMAMPERWHALGRLQSKTEQPVLPLQMEPRPQHHRP